MSPPVSIIGIAMSDQELLQLELNTDSGFIGGMQNVIAASRQAGNSPLTILLHGAGGGARSMAGLAQSLAIRGPLLIPDLSGYGRTAFDPGAAANLGALNLHCLVIDSLLAAFHQPQQPIIIIGHSMGGFLGLLTALADKWPVQALVAIEPVAFSVLDPVEDAIARSEDLDKVLALDAALKAGDPEPALAEFIGYWGNTDWAAFSDSMRQTLLKQASQIGFETLAVARDNTPSKHYTKLNLPVLLIQGELTVPPAIAAVNRLRNLLPKVDVQTIAGVAHMHVVRHPKPFAVVINELLNHYSDSA